MKKNQYGFAALEVVVTVVVLAVLGAVGWYVYQKNNSDDTKTDASQNTGSEDSKKEGSKNPDNSKNSDGTPKTYLLITDWGVRAPYDSDQKLTVDFVDVRSQKIASFSSEQLTALDPACSLKADAGGTIERFAPTEPTYADGTGPTAEEFAKTDSRFRKVGGYYYFFEHAQSGCGDTTKTESLQHRVNDLVEALVPKLETTP